MFCKVFVFFKFILSPLVCKCKNLTHNKAENGCPWISICAKNHLYTCTFYPIFLLKEYLHLVLLLFILMNYFQFNLTPSWSCLLKRLAWLLGLLCNWSQSIQLKTRVSSKSKWSIRSRQLKCWRGIRFIQSQGSNEHATVPHDIHAICKANP
jgi:hypothetical protein